MRPAQQIKFSDFNIFSNSVVHPCVVEYSAAWRLEIQGFWISENLLSPIYEYGLFTSNALLMHIGLHLYTKSTWGFDTLMVYVHIGPRMNFFCLRTFAIARLLVHMPLQIKQMSCMYIFCAIE